MAVRWTARLLSLGVVGMAAVLLVQDRWPNPASGTALAAAVLFLFLAACAGLLLAWLLEGSGGMLAIVGVAAAYLASLVATGHLPSGWLLSVAAVNGFLFILARALRVSLSHAAAPDADRRPS